MAHTSTKKNPPERLPPTGSKLSKIPNNTGGNQRDGSRTKPDGKQANGAVHVTFFPTYGAQSKTEAELTLIELRDEILRRTASSKARLPWLKLAVFGNKRSEKNCLRFNDNTIKVSGAELDYDDGVVTFEEAIEIVTKANLMALLYTSANYKPDAPKWRLLLPASQLSDNDKRKKWVARANGLFGGIFDPASFTLSQAFYYGGVAKNPSHRAVVIEGDYIDQRGDLDVGAIFKKGNGKDDEADWDNTDGALKLDWSEPVANILNDLYLHDNIRDLAASMVQSNVSPGAAKGLLRALMQNSSAIHDERWQDRFDDIDRAVEGAVRKYAQPEPSREGALFDPWAQYIVPEFPLKILPPVAQEFVVAQSEVIGVDQASMAMCVLGAFSGAIDHRIELKMMRYGDWKVRSRLWVMLSGEASLKKTPEMNAATRPLENYQRELQKAYLQKVAEYKKAKKKDGDELEEPERPPQHIVNDTTIEALGEVLARSGRGTLVKRDEISGWLGSMEQYTSKGGANAVRGFWLTAFDGGYHTVLRISRDDLHIDNLSVSIIGGIQPKKLAEHGLLKLTSDGLLQRFVPVVMTPASFPIDRPSGTEAYNALMRELLTATDPVGPFGRYGVEGTPIGLRTHELTFNDPALEVMNDLRLHLDHLKRASGGIATGFQSFIGKLDGISGSLALILHMAADPKAGICNQVSEKTARNVHRLVTDFIIPHAHVFYRTGESDTNGERLRKLASWILTNDKDRFVASDLAANVRDFRGLTLQEVNERVSPLVAADWIKPSDKGPLHKAWNVNPTVFKQFEAQAKKEEAEKTALAKLMNSPRKGHTIS